MTTVAQMIEWMKTLPQDAEVQCGAEVTRNWSTTMEMKDVNIDECSVLDYTSPADCANYPQMAGKVIIRLQAEDWR
jgi:hypothetical protein